MPTRGGDVPYTPTTNYTEIIRLKKYPSAPIYQYNNYSLAWTGRRDFGGEPLQTFAQFYIPPTYLIGYRHSLWRTAFHANRVSHKKKKTIVVKSVKISFSKISFCYYILLQSQKHRMFMYRVVYGVCYEYTILTWPLGVDQIVHEKQRVVTWN